MSNDTSSPPSWMDEGFGDVEKEAKKTRVFTPFRFWMKPNTKTKLTFVNDLPFSFFEHQLKINGKWQNFFTCKRKECPLCKAGNTANKMYAWVVVDHTTWTDNKGNQHQDEVRLFVCKAKPALRMQKLREKNDGLRGLRVEIERVGEGFSYSTGDQIDADEKYSEEKIKTLRWWPKQKVDDKGNPIGHDWSNATTETWIEVFAPRENDELKGVVRRMADEPEGDDRRNKRDDGEGRGGDEPVKW